MRNVWIDSRGTPRGNHEFLLPVRFSCCRHQFWDTVAKLPFSHSNILKKMDKQKKGRRLPVVTCIRLDHLRDRSDRSLFTG